jgi:beta-N-acetylhexosaminidase
MINVVWSFLLSVIVAGAAPAIDPVEARIDTIIQGLTVEQKVGQLMMIGFGGKEMGPEIERLLKAYQVGAVALYSRNVSSPAQVRKLIQDIRRVTSSGVQPFLAIDQEGGNVVRVRDRVAVLPGTMLLGATRDPVLAFLAGQAQAVDLRMLGFDMNLAPVLDTNHNPRNPVINVRAFSDRAPLVSEMGTAFVRGQQHGGLATVAKHFPGHGTTAHDSHFSLPRIQLDLDQMLATELTPFSRAIDSGLDAIMTAHVQMPAIDPDGTPTSLSRAVITDLLRKRLHFNGLVLTDDLEMRAISESRGVGPAAVQAIQAGADMVMVIWTPRRKKEVYETLLAAVEKGSISVARLDTSVRRILRLKAKRGTLDRLEHKDDDPLAYLPNAYHQQVAKTIAIRGMTLVDNKRSLLPICTGERVLIASPYRLFNTELTRFLPGATKLPLRLVSSRKHRERELARLVELAPKHRLVVIGMGNAYQAWLVQQLLKRVKTPVVAVSFGSPYLIRYFPKISGYLCTFSYLPVALQAAAEALAGRQSITGRLPIRLSERYPYDHGLTIRRNSCIKATAAAAQ